jgi:hypothetical protein
MDENLEEQIKLHSAGATVRHLSNFDDLKSYNNGFELSQEFINKWVIPFYMEIGDYYDNSWVEKVKLISNEITREVTLKLLRDFNWRTRLVGAYFSAVKNYKEQIEIIGTHLLKSEVCCVGHIYSIVLASYNDEKTLQYLTDYLDYYLLKPELYFEQKNVLESVAYLDKENNTNNLKKHIESWTNLLIQRKQLSKQNILRTAKILLEQEGKEKADKYLEDMTSSEEPEIKITFDIEHTEKQVKILNELKDTATNTQFGASAAF